MDNIKDKSKDKLKAFLAAQVTALFGDILDLTEVALGDPGRQKALRGKVLKLSNDVIRSVQREVEERYTVSYVPPATDVIFVRGQTNKS